MTFTVPFGIYSIETHQSMTAGWRFQDNIKFAWQPSGRLTDVPATCGGFSLWCAGRIQRSMDGTGERVKLPHHAVGLRCSCWYDCSHDLVFDSPAKARLNQASLNVITGIALFARQMIFGNCNSMDGCCSIPSRNCRNHPDVHHCMSRSVGQQLNNNMGIP